MNYGQHRTSKGDKDSLRATKQQRTRDDKPRAIRDTLDDVRKARERIAEWERQIAADKQYFRHYQEWLDKDFERVDRGEFSVTEEIAKAIRMRRGNEPKPSTDGDHEMDGLRELPFAANSTEEDSEEPAAADTRTDGEKPEATRPEGEEPEGNKDGDEMDVENGDSARQATPEPVPKQVTFQNIPNFGTNAWADDEKLKEVPPYVPMDKSEGRPASFTAKLAEQPAPKPGPVRPEERKDFACEFYWTRGYCKLGDRCPWAHEWKGAFMGQKLLREAWQRRVNLPPYTVTAIQGFHARNKIRKDQAASFERRTHIGSGKKRDHGAFGCG
ncbi:hypothetical protein DOTSEDRAFT_28290 [Dothistroma septosporum NZE10]|uniref:C3H1-type domain-containing protein n=1 Tax=Dothistroma septosporum (strain NZE10 / CBS 128990) TaxID=675120 RepID=M2XI06_DOTSN|nr:hypothetical protein DOTSEDRAFT_28290 [Dothistroma septosporum NZE10]